MGHHGNSFLSFGVAPVGNIGGWIELGRTTLGSANQNITVSSLANKRYYMVLAHTIGATIPQVRLGNSTIDSGSNYASRLSNNGGADTTETSVTEMYGSNSTVSAGLQIAYFANLSDKEKLMQLWSSIGGTTGAGNAPSRTETVGKWVNTSNPLDIINWIDVSATNFSTGSEVVVLGWDPTDTHTTNFWEPLADVDLSTGESDVIDSGTFTAKKYLWVQLFNAGNSAGEERLTFNSDTGSNYARRLSANGGSDSTNASQAFIENMFTGGTATNESLGNGFIINNSANEKLLFTHVVINNTAGAGTAPGRLESACKWANTASQITKLTFTSTSGAFAKNSFLKVWGSN